MEHTPTVKNRQKEYICEHVDLKCTISAIYNCPIKRAGSIL